MSHQHDYDHSSCPILREGASGASVKKLQKCLLGVGFNPGKIDGVFGAQTKKAVLSFQKSKHLTQDGIVGRDTWAALGVSCNTAPTNHCPVLVESNSGPAVANLQRLLKTNGFSTGTIDGVFGPLTKSAVKSFQKSRKLVPDGIVGIKTWSALGAHCL